MTHNCIFLYNQRNEVKIRPTAWVFPPAGICLWVGVFKTCSLCERAVCMCLRMRSKCIERVMILRTGYAPGVVLRSSMNGLCGVLNASYLQVKRHQQGFRVGLSSCRLMFCLLLKRKVSKRGDFICMFSLHHVLAPDDTAVMPLIQMSCPLIPLKNSMSPLIN